MDIFLRTESHDTRQDVRVDRFHGHAWNSLSALIPLPGRPTVRYYRNFAPNAKLRPLVVQAGALAPRGRDKPQAAGHDCQVALTDAELAHHAVEQARQTSGRLAWSVAMKITRKIDTLQCPCAGRRKLAALIDQPPVVKKILAHLALATEALTKPEDPVWLPKKSTLRGPPEELFPTDRQGPPATGPRAGRGSLHLSEPFFDELPAEDWAA